MPVGPGPSGNTWPRCPWQRAQWTSVRVMKRLLSVVVATASSSGFQKLGQPVPLSNLVSDENNGCPHAAHLNVPSRFSEWSGLEPGDSVPCFRSTWNCSGVSVPRHSSSVFSMIEIVLYSTPLPSARPVTAASHQSGGFEQADCPPSVVLPIKVPSAPM